MKEYSDARNELEKDLAPIMSSYGQHFRTPLLASDLAKLGYRKQSEGEWKKVEEDLGGGVKTYRFACTNCGFLKNTLTGNFCPKCGAKMKGGAE